MIPGPSKYESRVVLTRPPCSLFDVMKLLQEAVVMSVRSNTIGGSKIQSYLHTSVTLVYDVEQQL
jgi:hypothetical protein